MKISKILSSNEQKREFDKFFFSFLGDLKETLDFYINLKSGSSNRAEIFLLHSL